MTEREKKIEIVKSVLRSVIKNFPDLNFLFIALDKEKETTEYIYNMTNVQYSQIIQQVSYNLTKNAIRRIQIKESQKEYQYQMMSKFSMIAVCVKPVSGLYGVDSIEESLYYKVLDMVKLEGVWYYNLEHYSDLFRIDSFKLMINH